VNRLSGWGKSEEKERARTSAFIFALFLHCRACSQATVLLTCILFTGYSPVNLHPHRPGDRIFRAGGTFGKGEGDRRGKIGVKESLEDALKSSLALLRFWWQISMHT